MVSSDEPTRSIEISEYIVAGRNPRPAACPVPFSDVRGPKSTTQLVALTGQTLGSVGGHLRVLLDAGLVRRRRSGRSVLYYRTDLGEILARA